MSEFRELSEIVSFTSGGTPSKSNPEYWGGNYPWLSAKDLKARVVSTSIERLTDLGYRNSSVAKKGSLLILVRGMTLHKDIPICLTGCDVAFNQDVKALELNEACSAEYLQYYLLSMKSTLLNLVDSSGHGTGKLNTDLLKQFAIRVIPRSEQNSIADLLSTWDRAIEKTEKLIEAKEKKYRGLLHSLIIEPSINRNFKKVTIGQIFEPVVRKNSVGETNVLTTSALQGLVSQLKYYKKSVSAEDVSGYYLLRKSEFAYNRSSSKGYPFGVIKRLDESDQGVLSTLYLCLRLKDESSTDSDFYLHLFESGLLNRELVNICAEGARSHGLLNVSKSDFFGLQIPLPSIENQREIAWVLNLCLSEELKLQEYLTCLREQKQGLMQKLLTGKWRVIIEESSKGEARC